MYVWGQLAVKKLQLTPFGFARHLFILLESRLRFADTSLSHLTALQVFAIVAATQRHPKSRHNPPSMKCLAIYVGPSFQVDQSSKPKLQASHPQDIMQSSRKRLPICRRASRFRWSSLASDLDAQCCQWDPSLKGLRHIPLGSTGYWYELVGAGTIQKPQITWTFTWWLIMMDLASSRIVAPSPWWFAERSLQGFPKVIHENQNFCNQFIQCIDSIALIYPCTFLYTVRTYSYSVFMCYLLITYLSVRMRIYIYTYVYCDYVYYNIKYIHIRLTHTAACRQCLGRLQNSKKTMWNFQCV